MPDEQIWQLTDHLCRHCSGRVLKSVPFDGPSTYRCAECGLSKTHPLPSSICWCGFSYYSGGKKPFRCLPFSIIEHRPEYLSLFLVCGSNPADNVNEVGVVHVDLMKQLVS